MPSYLKLNQTIISPGDTAAHALFSTPTAAISYAVSPLSTNSDTVLVGAGPTPLGSVGLGWAPTLSGCFYNLADVYFQCSNATDGVIVLWYSNPT